MLKLCKINACPNGTLGLHLSRAPWDPYPWVSGVTENSSAYLAGIRIGDTILEYNDMDVLGWKIFELANKIHSHWDCGGKLVNFLIWRNKSDHQYQQNNDSGPNINQQSLQKFATCLQNIAQLLECPVCLEVIKPPGWQCCNGHVLCNGCRCRTIKCPICRVSLGPRGRCLLSDKLFTLLAESFPCDGVKNDNKNGRCPVDNHKIKRTTFKTTSTITTAEERNLLIDKPTSQNACNNNNNNNGICNGQRIRITTNPKDDQNINKKEIISIKVKSPQILSVPLTLQSTEPTYSPSSVVTISNSNTFSCTSVPVITTSLATTKSTTKSSTTTVNQQQNSILHKNYHCPTGKSCNFQENDENFEIYNTINNFSSTIINTTTTLQKCNRNNIYNGQNINQNIQWDILTHLRRVHQLFICQYYGNFGENFQIDLIKQNKSIFCISIDTKYLKCSENTYDNNTILNFNNQNENFVQIQQQNLHTDSLYLTVQDINPSIANNDTFIPNLSNFHSNDDNLSDDVTSINSVNTSYSINNRKIKFSDTELFFIAKIPLVENENNNNDNKNIISNLSTTAIPITTNNLKIISRKSSLTNDRYRNDNIFDTDGGFNGATDINRNNIEKNSVNKFIVKDCSGADGTTTITIDDTMIPSSDLVISCRNFAKSSCLPTTLTSGYIEKFAIFIWYCGNECNVKNFKAFIKSNGKIEQTTIPIHSINKSWDVIRCRKEFLEFNIASGENMFDIIIDSI